MPVRKIKKILKEHQDESKGNLGKSPDLPSIWRSPLHQPEGWADAGVGIGMRGVVSFNCKSAIAF